MLEGAFGRSDAEIDLLVRGMRSGIAVVGFGYIGTVIGAVLADRGWPVTGIDVRQSVVDEINLGKTTVAEPGLSELVANNVRVGRLRATTDFGAIADNDFVIVNVGTPLGPDYEPIVDDITAAARGPRGAPAARPRRHPQEHGAARTPPKPSFGRSSKRPQGYGPGSTSGWRFAPSASPKAKPSRS